MEGAAAQERPRQDPGAPPQRRARPTGAGRPEKTPRRPSARGPESPLWERRPSHPKGGPAGTRPAPRPARPAPGSRPAATRPTHGQPAPARPGGPQPRPQLKAKDDRLLIESDDFDLFGTGKSSKVCVCPECNHELVKIVCLGTPVRACLECKGIWLGYSVVRDFARENDWFRQLGAAIQPALRKRAEK